MKNFTMTFVTILFVCSASFSQTWRSVDMGESHYIYAIEFISPSTGFWGGDSNLVKKTTDGGKTWQTKYKMTGTGNTYIRSIDFVNDNIGFCAGDKGLLLKTTDGGETWTEIVVAGYTGTMNSVKFLNENVGYLAAKASSGYSILRTTDGGATWAVSGSAAGTINEIEFAERTTSGIAVGNATVNLYYTTDGLTWNKSEMPTLGGYSYITSNIQSVSIVNSQLAYACGNGSSITMSPSILLKSTDGGKSWQFLEQNNENKIYQTLYSISFKDELNGIAVGGSTSNSAVTKTTDGGQTWTTIYTPFGGTINKISTIGDEIWAGGYYGLVGYSSDFGSTWNTKVPGSFNTIYSIYVKGNKILLGSIAGLMFRSTDGGLTWSSEFVNVDHVSPTIQDMFFLNDNIGYMARDNRQVCKTTDGGNTWTSLLKDSVGTSVVTYSVYFFNENVGFAAGKIGLDFDAIYKTTDGGVTWAATTNLLQGAIRSIAFADENHGVVVAENLKAAYTTDGGSTWTPSTFNGVPDTHIDETNLMDVVFNDGLNAVAVGDSIILKSTDGGANWNYIPVEGMNHKLSAVTFIDNTSGYALGNISASPRYVSIFETKDAGNTWNISQLDTNIVRPGSDTGKLLVTEEGNFWITGSMTYTTTPLTDVEDNRIETPSSFSLEQNYPNPFNPSTIIRYHVAEYGKVTLKVFDVLGREITTLVNEVKSPGTFEVKFNGSEISSGVYFTRLQAGNKSDIKKMMLIK